MYYAIAIVKMPNLYEHAMIGPYLVNIASNVFLYIEDIGIDVNTKVGENILSNVIRYKDSSIQ